MEENTRRSYSGTLLILSVIINIMLATYAGFSLRETAILRDRVEELSDSYGELSESYSSLADLSRNLESQLNMTVTQLEYYKGLAEYYSNTTTPGNASTGVMGHTTIPIVATYRVGGWFRSELKGVVMTADVELREGSGRVLVNTVPRIGIDIQTSARTAVRVAEETTGVYLGGTDVILTITSSEEAEVVDGPSAGAAITVALIAAINGQELSPGVHMTGTIRSDGTVGPVGGVLEKALAAAKNGSRYLIVPEGQGSVIVYVPKTTHPFPGMTITTYEQEVVDLSAYLEEEGYSVTVEEVESVVEAYAKFSGAE